MEQYAGPIDLESDDVSPVAQDLIVQLLNYDPKKRLGCPGICVALRHSECTDCHVALKLHAFFDTFDWHNSSKNEAPFVPTPADQYDTSYFNSPAIIDTEAGETVPSFGSGPPANLEEALRPITSVPNLMKQDSTLEEIQADLTQSARQKKNRKSLLPRGENQFDDFHFKSIDALNSANKSASKR
eukprot:Partr_v1_DN28869_c1_g1_i1_m32984